jgi:phosphoglycolate phosphatase
MAGTPIRFRNVLLDLDGTLTDPFQGIAACIRHAMMTLGYPAPTHEDLCRAVGPPLRQTFGRLLDTTDAGRIEHALRLYRERFAASGLFENRVYEGIPQMLARLRAAGCSLFIATSKPQIFAERIVDHFGLTTFLTRVYGSGLDGSRENKADLLRFLLHTEKLDPRLTVMIGDRSHDMIAARENSLCTIGVAWGYGSREELEQAAADVILDDPDDVVRFVVTSRGM